MTAPTPAETAVVTRMRHLLRSHAPAASLMNHLNRLGSSKRREIRVFHLLEAEILQDAVDRHHRQLCRCRDLDTDRLSAAAPVDDQSGIGFRRAAALIAGIPRQVEISSQRAAVTESDFEVSMLH